MEQPSSAARRVEKTITVRDEELKVDTEETLNANELSLEEIEVVFARKTEEIWVLLKETLDAFKTSHGGNEVVNVVATHPGLIEPITTQPDDIVEVIKKFPQAGSVKVWDTVATVKFLGDVLLDLQNLQSKVARMQSQGTATTKPQRAIILRDIKDQSQQRTIAMLPELPAHDETLHSVENATHGNESQGEDNLKEKNETHDDNAQL